MPVLFATLPTLTNLRWLADPLFHQIVAIFCAVLVVRAIGPDYRKHRDGRVVSLASTGLGLLFFAAFVLPDSCCSTSMQLRAEGMQRSQKVVLVSSTSGLLKSDAPNAGLAVFPKAQEELAKAPGEVCEHTSKIGRPLLSAMELEEQLGESGAQVLIQSQPFLSPIGGVFLIIAHIMNIRLRCCRRTRCSA